jgi:hypothetical protein
MRIVKKEIEKKFPIYNCLLRIVANALATQKKIFLGT